MQAFHQRDFQLIRIYLTDLDIGGVRALAGDREGAGKNMVFSKGDAADRALDPVPLDRPFHRLHVFL